MQTSCSNRQSGVPVESHTQPWRVGDLWADTVGSQSRAHGGMMVSGLVSIEPSPRSCPFVTILTAIRRKFGFKPRITFG